MKATYWIAINYAQTGSFSPYKYKKTLHWNTKSNWHFFQSSDRSFLKTFLVYTCNYNISVEIAYFCSLTDTSPHILQYLLATLIFHVPFNIPEQFILIRWSWPQLAQTTLYQNMWQMHCLVFKYVALSFACAICRKYAVSCESSYIILAWNVMYSLKDM